MAQSLILRRQFLNSTYQALHLLPLLMEHAQHFNVQRANLLVHLQLNRRQLFRMDNGRRRCSRLLSSLFSHI